MELKDQLQNSKVSSVHCKTYLYREKNDNFNEESPGL